MLTIKQIVRFLLVLSGLLISGELFACYIAPPYYLCWEYWEEYSADGITKTTPDSSYYFPVEGGATVKHTFLLYNSTKPDGAYGHKLTVAPDDLGVVSVVSQPAFDVPYQQTEYAVIEYTAPMSLGKYDIDIVILDENGKGSSSENGLFSQIEVTSLPAPPPPDDPNPYPDYEPPWAEVAGIESSYVVGDSVFYTATAGDNGNLLSWVDFLVIDANGNQLYAKLWDDIRLDSFQESDSFPTTDWAEGTYYYELRVKDVAGNEELVEDSSFHFQLATLPPDEPPPPPPPPPDEPKEAQICGREVPVKLSSTQALERDGNMLVNTTPVTILSEVGDAREVKVNSTDETGYVAYDELDSGICDVSTPVEPLKTDALKEGQVLVSTPVGIYAHVYPNVGSSHVDVNGDGMGNMADVIPYNTFLTVLPPPLGNWFQVSFEGTDGQTKEGWIYRRFLAEAQDIAPLSESKGKTKETGVIAWAHDMTVDLRMRPNNQLNEILWESYEDTKVQVIDHKPPFYFVKIETPGKVLDNNTLQQYGRLYEGIFDLNAFQIGMSGWVHQDFIMRDGQTYDDTPFAYPFIYETAKNAPFVEKGLVNQIFFEEVMGKVHQCIDYNLKEETPVRAAAPGTVILAKPLKNGLGNTVVLSHDNGYFTVYAHLQEILVAKDEVIPRVLPIDDTTRDAFQIGTVGGTAPDDAGSKKPHLHFCVRNDGEPKGDWKKSLNPTKYVAGYDVSDAHQCVKGLIVDAGIREGDEIASRCDTGMGGNCTVFKDVDCTNSEHYWQDIKYAAKNDWVTKDNPTFRPTDLLTRSEATAIALRASNLDDFNQKPKPEKNCFPDDEAMVDASKWVIQSVCYAFERGIISGYTDTDGNPTGKFRPNDPITFDQLLAIVLNSFGFDKSCWPKHEKDWSLPYRAAGEYFGIDLKVGNKSISRGLAVHFLRQLYSRRNELNKCPICDPDRDNYSYKVVFQSPISTDAVRYPTHTMLSVTIRNTGNATWYPECSFKFGTQKEKSVLYHDGTDEPSAKWVSENRVIQLEHKVDPDRTWDISFQIGDPNTFLGEERFGIMSHWLGDETFVVWKIGDAEKTIREMIKNFRPCGEAGSNSGERVKTPYGFKECDFVGTRNPKNNFSYQYLGIVEGDDYWNQMKAFIKQELPTIDESLIVRLVDAEKTRINAQYNPTVHPGELNSVDLRGVFDLAIQTGELKPQFVVLHRTAALHHTDTPAKSAIDTWTPRTVGSVQYLIDNNGTIYQLLKDSEIGWHVGQRERKTSVTNANSIGIEVTGGYHEDSKTWEPLTEAQNRAVSALTLELVTRLKIPSGNVCQHEKVSAKKDNEGGLYSGMVIEVLQNHHNPDFEECKTDKEAEENNG
ncbi:MAG TPA: hypothetical protein ENG03_02955 [Thioploca sp.]|nr:MAG: hypothetical protein DRR19_02025 [Gammaproteobacteria bacterium]HDN26054.1 hypothetical protein [Thioploca sp.]